MQRVPLNDELVWSVQDVALNWKSYRDEFIRLHGVQEPAMSDDDIALTNANLGLAVELIQELLELPDDVDPQLYKVNVVVLPPPERNPPELDEENLRIARAQAAEGKTVMIWTIGSGEAVPWHEYEARLTTEPSPQ
jgi:hypothetical protein